MKMRGNGLRLIRVFFRLVFEMIRNYKKLNNDPDHNFLICKECRICQNSIRDCSKRGISKIGKLVDCVKPPLFF